MLEKAPVLGGQHRLDEMIGQLVDRRRILVDDAAMADLVAVAVEEGDGEIVPRLPVAGGFLKRWQRQRQQQHAARGTGVHALAGDLEHRLPDPAGAEPAEEDGDLLPDLADPETGVPDGGIDPGVDAQKDVGALAGPVFLIERVLHGSWVHCGLVAASSRHASV